MDRYFKPVYLQDSGYSIMAGRIWYIIYKENVNSRLISLKSVYDIETINAGFLVSFSDESGKRYFTLFNSPEEYWDYQKTFPEKSRSFYEIILGTNKQKPHFDVDITLDSKHFCMYEDVLISLKIAICKTLIDIGRQSILEDIYVYSSHGDRKKSYHIVVNGYCHNNHKEAKKFYDIVINHMNPQHTDYVDKAVYSSFQNFRLLGSQKHSSGRMKILDGSTKENINYENLLLSLVTNCGGCTILDELKTQCAEEREVLKIEIENKHIDKAIELLEDYLKLIKEPKNAIEYDRTDNNLILLKRNKATYCDMCKRKHESENPFMTIRKDGSVMFFCRRGEKPATLGHVHKKETISSSMQYFHIS